MTDADLIYSALLRAERRLQPASGTAVITPAVAEKMAAYRALSVLREEIGYGLAKEGR